MPETRQIKSLRHEFYSFVVPSLFAFALSGMYSIVDGFFIGQAIGDLGLATINVAYPLTALIQALGTGIGMGGAVLYSIHVASAENTVGLEKKLAARRKAERFVATTFLLLLFVSAIVVVITYRILPQIVVLLGAYGPLLQTCHDYLFVIGCGAVFQIVGTALIPLVRNFGHATVAMFVMILGFITNIYLDYLFIQEYQWGVKGAALATVLSQAIAMVGGLIYMWRQHLCFFKVNLHEALTMVKPIISIAVAPFGLTISPNIVLVLINRSSAIYGGDVSVACYACIAYVTCVVYLMLQGIGDGSQPLISHFYGRNDANNIKLTRTMAYLSSIALSVFSMMALFLCAPFVGPLFGASEMVSRYVSLILPIFLLGLPFVSYCRVTAAVFYATNHCKLSYVLTYAETIVLFLLLLFVPAQYGQMGVWWSAVGAQLIAAFLAIVLKLTTDRHLFVHTDDIMRV